MFTTDLRFIEAAERRLGVRLPESFRCHLLAANGGAVTILELEWELTPVHDTSDGERTRRTSQDVVHETAQARNWPGFPPKGVSVGSDGFGNHLVFLPSEQDDSVLNPGLFIFWHEGSELEYVAADFNAAIAAG